jgi:hypothetical protein
MNHTVLLVDYENVGKINLGAVPDDMLVPFFFGASQKTVPTEFLKAALRLGNRFLPIDIEGHGKNALDFHIAFYLGELLKTEPRTSCVILSKDKGFEPLIKHLVGRGFAVRRAATLEEAFAPPGSVNVLTHARADTQHSLLMDALQWLQDMDRKKRPRKRKGLVAHLHSHCGKKVATADIEGFVDQLIADNKLAENNAALTYRF